MVYSPSSPDVYVLRLLLAVRRHSVADQGVHAEAKLVSLVSSVSLQKGGSEVLNRASARGTTVIYDNYVTTTINCIYLYRKPQDGCRSAALHLDSGVLQQRHLQARRGTAASVIGKIIITVQYSIII